jgi:hypothetical protein
VDGCCDGIGCPPEAHARHHRFTRRLQAGMRYALGDLWGEMAGWFAAGLLLAGVITVLIPDDVFTRQMASGLPAMLLMLVVGIPLYICASGSTPIAAALILKGVSPGAALVFLLAGPATNVTTLTVLSGVLGRRATAVYLAAIAVCALVCGVAVDQVYAALGLSARAMVGQAGEIMPVWLRWAGALCLIALSIPPVLRRIRPRPQPAADPTGAAAADSDPTTAAFPAARPDACGAT